MKKKLITTFVLGFLVFLSFWSYRILYEDTYFIPVDIVGDARVGVPYIKVNIEDKEYFLELDIGFSREVSIASGGLNELKDKVFVSTVKSVGYQGKAYKKTPIEFPV